ncbi:hypothetical protein [Rurimicrobium arvi]|uniref:HEAT repeat domain-containing protein n=1 Tax=Rurimicrobium arvi TaxID=2049916 RepID=A0ABP8MSW9_9BACT
MDIQKALLSEHSKEQAAAIAGFAGSDEQHFKELFDLFLHGDKRTVQRAAWVLSMYADAHPEKMPPYVHRMLEYCCQGAVDGTVKRNVVRILQFVAIPADCEEMALELCFSWLEDPKEAIAVRCFSMTVLEHLCNRYPELKESLAQLIRHALDHEVCSAAFRNRAQKTLQALKGRKKAAGAASLKKSVD